MQPNPGASIGRFFGIHDDENQWNRAGTLPPNNRALGYDLVPQRDNDNTDPMGITPSGPLPPDAQERSRRKWGIGRFTDTIRRLHRTEPSSEDAVKTLPSFWPIMTILIATVEVAMMISTTVTAGLAPIRFAPQINVSTIIGFDDILDSVSKEIVPNFFIGTSKSALIHNGAMYTPVSHRNNACH